MASTNNSKRRREEKAARKAHGPAGQAHPSGSRWARRHPHSDGTAPLHAGGKELAVQG